MHIVPTMCIFSIRWLGMRENGCPLTLKGERQRSGWSYALLQMVSVSLLFINWIPDLFYLARWWDLNIFEYRDRLTDDYASYLESFIQIRDPPIRSCVEQQSDQGVLWPDPLLQLNPLFAQGDSIDELVAQGILHQECARIFRKKSQNGPAGRTLRRHKHQEEAIRVARGGHSYVLTTGTGSGKSLAYIVPIVDYVLR